MGFDESYYRGNGQNSDRPALWFYERLARSYFQPGRVLDFGSGTGYFLRRLNRHFAVDGYEISAHARDVSHSMLPELDIYSDLEQINSGVYTGITALHVFEHISDTDLARVLSALRKSLLIEGRILCVMPVLNGRGHVLKGEKWAGFRDNTHINLKTTQEWRSFFSRAGFSIIATGADGLWDFPYSNMPLPLDFLRFGWSTSLQFLLGRLVLPVDSGESVIMVLQPGS